MLYTAGRRVWIEITDCDIESPDSSLELSLGRGTELVRPFKHHNRLSDGVFVSTGERLQIRLKTGDVPRGKGFRAIYKTGKCYSTLDCTEKIMNTVFIKYYILVVISGSKFWWFQQAWYVISVGQGRINHWAD